MKLVKQQFDLLWRHRHMLAQTTWNDIRARHAGSVLGLVWLLLFPVLFLGCYALIYLFILGIKLPQFSSVEYVAVIFCGLIPFLGFADCLGMGVGSVTANANLIKNTLFPIELIPVKAVLATQCTQVVGTVLLVAAVFILGHASLWMLLLPVIWLFQLMFAVGLLWILSSLNVYFRDLQNLVSVLVLMLMMLSPIAYTPEMVPDNLRPLLQFNPLYYVIISYQDCLMRSQFPRDGILFVLGAMSLVTFVAGYWFFSRMKRVFVDNV